MTHLRKDADACSLLDADHRAVKKLFKAYESLVGSRARDAAGQRLDLARQICQELTVHAAIEEEIFYPALREALKDTAPLAEAEVEHGSVKELIAQLEALDQADEAFDARVKVLGEYVDHHVKEERNQIFPAARAARRLDLLALRDELQARKDQLMGVTAD